MTMLKLVASARLNSNLKAMRTVAILLSIIPCVMGMSIPTPLDTLTSGLASICRLPFGVTVANVPETTKNSIELKQLYDVENSVDCRKVREAISELDLVVDLVIPVATNSRCLTDQDYQYALPQDAIIPRLVLSDEGEEIVLSGSDQILEYFETKCGLPTKFKDEKYGEALQVVFNVGNVIASAMRVGRGNVVSPTAREAPRPNKPLVLYSYEGNQFCRLVREVLTELDIVYELRSAGKESPRRQELLDISGKSQCPYLIDPNNNDLGMPESADIIEYLYRNYARYTPPSEILQWTSNNIMSLAKPIFQSTAPALAGSSSDTYETRLEEAKAKLEDDIQSSPVVVYTYSLSPFSSETTKLLDSLNIEYTEISLGAEWIPGLIQDSAMRVALMEKTNQSSLPHIFVGGESIGGLFSGTPGLLPLLEEGRFKDMVKGALSADLEQSAFQ